MYEAIELVKSPAGTETRADQRLRDDANTHERRTPSCPQTLGGLRSDHDTPAQPRIVEGRCTDLLRRDSDAYKYSTPQTISSHMPAVGHTKDRVAKDIAPEIEYLQRRSPVFGA